MKSCIVVPAYNNSILTLACLNSLLQFTSNDVDIVIVDDHSNDAEFNQLLSGINDSFFRRVDICRCVANVGFARACNQGAALAGRKCDTLIFLNNDTVVTEFWYENLVNKLSNDIGIVGSKLLYPESKYSQIHSRQIEKGTIQHAGIMLNEDMLPKHEHQFQKADFALANVRKTFPYVTGASIAIKKSVFEDVGGFNSKYTNGCEDLDLCVKVRKNNLHVLYAPESIAFHHETSTRNPETSQQNLALFIEEYRLQLEIDKTFVCKEM